MIDDRQIRTSPLLLRFRLWSRRPVRSASFLHLMQVEFRSNNLIPDQLQLLVFTIWLDFTEIL